MLCARVHFDEVFSSEYFQNFHALILSHTHTYIAWNQKREKKLKK